MPEWIEISPGYVFVTTLYSDKIHVRLQFVERMLCGRAFPDSDWADYPAQAMPLAEMCLTCVRSYRRQVPQPETTDSGPQLPW